MAGLLEDMRRVMSSSIPLFYRPVNNYCQSTGVDIEYRALYIEQKNDQSNSVAEASAFGDRVSVLVSTLRAIEHSPLNHRSYVQLREFVLSGAVPMGDRLDENALARQLHVSRTPVREAIGKLVKEGLVEYRPFQGNFVRKITFQQVRDVFEVRGAIEGLAARLAASKLPEDGLDALTAILEDVHQALEQGDMVRYALADRKFHSTIAHYSGNSALVDTLDNLSAQIQLARALANRDPHVVQRTARERPLILEAFRRRDADEAGRLLEEHIKGVFDALCSQFREGLDSDPHI